MSRTDLPDDFRALAELIARADDAAEPDPIAVAAARPRRRRRRLAAGIVTLVVLAAIGTYIPLTLLAPAGAATIAIEQPVVTPPAAVTITLPSSGSSAVSLTGAEQFAGTTGTNGILAASGEAGPVPIASITKLVTAMVILDAKPLGEGEPGSTLAFTEADEDLYDEYYVRGATIQPMDGGDTMTQRDALEMLLVASASNYADVVSRWAFGSRSGFLSATRTWLAEKGLTSTTIVDPTGLDAGHVSTTTDLIALGRLALADPVVSEIVRSPTLDVPGLDPVRNNNTLLGIDGVTGLKTGTLDEAGSCLLFSAVMNVPSIDPISVVGVVLGGADRQSVDQAVQELLASIDSGFHPVPVIQRGDVLGTYTTPWGDDATIVAGETASVFTWSDTPVTVSMETETVTTGTSGTDVGRLGFVAENDTASVPLVLDGPIDGPDGWWRLTHPFELLG